MAKNAITLTRIRPADRIVDAAIRRNMVCPPSAAKPVAKRTLCSLRLLRFVAAAGRRVHGMSGMKRMKRVKGVANNHAAPFIPFSFSES